MAFKLGNKDKEFTETDTLKRLLNHICYGDLYRILKLTDNVCVLFRYGPIK